MLHDEQKLGLIKMILKDTNYSSTLIFASTREHVKQLNSELKRAGMQVHAFHSDLEQAEREELMMQFKSKRVPVLIGTDVLSRGIDVEGIDLVVNYDVPPDPEDYIHRIGRTARAERTGTAITFITTKDQNKFQRIEELIGREVTKMLVPETLGPAPEYNPQVRRKGGGGGKKKFFKRRNP